MVHRKVDQRTQALRRDALLEKKLLKKHSKYKISTKTDSLS